MATNDAESKPSGVELPKDDATNEQNVASIRPLDLNDVLLFFQSSISRTLCRLSTPFKLSKQLLSLFVSPILRYLVDFILLLFGLWLCLYILRLVLFSVLGVLATSLFRFFAANLFGTLKEWGVPLWGVSSNLVRYAAKSFTGSNFLEIGAATPFMGAITCKAIGLWCESESANGTLTFREEVEAAYDGMKITHELIWTMNTLSHSPKDLVLYSVGPFSCLADRRLSSIPWDIVSPTSRIWKIGIKLGI